LETLGRLGWRTSLEEGRKALVSTWSDLNIEEIKLCRLPMLLDAVDLVCCSVPFAHGETR
jgi:hypothetical protein